MTLWLRPESLIILVKKAEGIYTITDMAILRDEKFHERQFKTGTFAIDPWHLKIKDAD